MTILLTVFGVSVGLLVGCVVLWSVERQRGERLVVTGFRRYLDHLLFSSEGYLQRFSFWYRYLILRWGWRTLVHTVLRSILLTLTYLYDWLMARFERNRRAAQELRRERKRWRERG